MGIDSMADRGEVSEMDMGSSASAAQTAAMKQDVVPTVRAVAVPGGDLAVELFPGDTEPVLALHGISSSRRLWGWLHEQAPEITLLAPGIPGYPWPDEPELDAELDRLFEAEAEDGILAALLREWAAAGSEPLIVDMMRSAVRAWEYEGTFQQKPEPVFDRLGEVDIPAALMVGDLDRPPLIACAEAAAERLPQCELIRMPGVDHLPSMREPAWITTVVTKYAAAYA